MKAQAKPWSEAARLYFDRRMLVILVLGFASGLPLLLTGGTLAIWMKENGLTNTAIGLFVLVGIPYNLKFLWAPVIDHVPVPVLARLIGQRRAWTVVIQAALMAAIVAMGQIDPAAAPVALSVMALIVAFLSASQDIVIDAYRIEILEDREQGAGSAMTQTGYRFGLLAAGAGALYMAEAIPWAWVYAVEAALILIGTIAILAAREPDRGPAARPRPTLKAAVIDPFVDFMRRPGWLVILTFILLYKFGDAFAGVMANPFYIEMQFTKIEIANVSKVFGLAATLVGVFVGGALVFRLGIVRALLISGILQAASNLMFALQAYVGHVVDLLAVTIAADNVTGGMGSAAFVAYLSSLTSVAYTATQYALLSSFMAIGRTVLASSSGWLADHVDWVSFFLISTVVALPGLALLWWMMRRYPTPGRDSV